MLKLLSYRVSARAVAAVCQALALLALARALGPSVFGSFVVGLSIGSLIASALGMGIPTRALRLSLEEKPSEMARAMVAIASFAAFANVGATMFIAVEILGTSLLVGMAAAIAAGTDQLTTAIQAILAGLQRPVDSVVVLLLQRLVPLAGISFAMVSSPALILEAYLAMTICVNLGQVVFFLRPTPLSALRRAVSGSFAYWSSSVAGSLANLDVVIVRTVSGSAWSGQYGAATRLVSPLNIVVGSLLAVLIPLAADEPDAQARQRLFKRARWSVCLVAVSLCLLAPLIASVAVDLLGQDYEQARLIMVGVVIGVSLSGVSQVVQAELITENRALAAAISVAVGTTLGLAALWLLAGLFGHIGLASGPALMQAIILVLMLASSRKGTRRNSS